MNVVITTTLFAQSPHNQDDRGEVTNLYGIKTGTPKVCARLLGELLETKFRRKSFGSSATDEWYIAIDPERGEAMALFASECLEGGLRDPSLLAYEVLLCVVSSKREAEVTHKLATSTRFRFMPASDRVERLVVQRLDELPSTV